MFSISLCMIVKNEEATLSRCLDSVKDVVDEIIITDTGSTDRTKEIAALYTDKIYDFEWIDDFSAARNFSYSKAEMDYILWLDADDVLLEEDAARLMAMKENTPPTFNSAMMKYNVGFDDKGRVNFSYYRERLSKRTCAFKWVEPVHEYLEVIGERFMSDICVTHLKPHSRESKRNIGIYEDILNRGDALSPRGLYYYARELKDHNRYAEAARRFDEFLSSGRGWIEDNINACGELSACYQAEGMNGESLTALLRSFEYDVPRPEICCKLGYHFKGLAKYRQAAYWFLQALNYEDSGKGWGFSRADYSGYIPSLELAVCLDKLGDYVNAARYNEMAGDYKPDSCAVRENREYFANRLKALKA